MNNIFVSRFIKGVMSTGIASLIAIVSGFLNIIIAVRFIPKEHFGVYILLQVVVSSVVTISDLGLNLSTTKYIAGSEGNARYTVVNTMLSLRIFTGLAIAAVIFLSKSVLVNLFKSELYSEIAIYVPLLFFLESISSACGSMLQGFHYYKKMAIAQIIMSILGFILLLIFVVVLRLEIMGLIYARIISSLICISYQLLPFYGWINMKFRKDLCKDVFYFGFPLGLNNILSFIFMRVDTILIGALLNPVQVAYYGTASKIPDASRQMFESFRSVFFPNMSELFVREKKLEAVTLLDNSLRLISFIALFGTLVVFVFQKEIVKLLFSVKYLEIAPVLSLLMVALSIGLISNVLGTSLVSAGFSKLPVIINIVDTVVNVAANATLIPLFGVIGAAYAAILARALTNPVNVWFLKRNGIQVNINEFLKPVFIFTACMAIYYLLGGSGILSKLFIILLYLFACKGLSVITRDDFLNFMKSVKHRQHPLNSEI